MSKTYEHLDISSSLALRMHQVARQLRKTPTRSEGILWAALRRQQLEGRKFRRQVNIGAFVVDFYCWTEKMVIEVDGGIHESQRAADAERQALIETLGLRFVRVSAAQVETDLPSVLTQIRAAFHSVSD